MKLDNFYKAYYMGKIMEKYYFGRDLIDVSFDRAEKLRRVGDSYFEKRLKDRIELYKKLISIIDGSSLPSSIAILNAHGTGITGD